ncbi:hypothetical protein DICVIV_04126 [Dictyocaulus viviparus]|uniref:Uncharacterized protein n=1 Tax=Dictyocaulus viviparus TaxID=29172 RepID=A0A0D8XZ27_DICVI|nr:hypothetical protein DICVIV_04126 [Dictyocaulus viviparus]
MDNSVLFSYIILYTTATVHGLNCYTGRYYTIPQDVMAIDTMPNVWACAVRVRVDIHSRRLIAFELYGIDNRLNLSSTINDKHILSCTIGYPIVMGLLNAEYICNHRDKCNYVLGFLRCMSYKEKKFSTQLAAQLILDAITDDLLAPHRPDDEEKLSQLFFFHKELSTYLSSHLNDKSIIMFLRDIYYAHVFNTIVAVLIIAVTFTYIHLAGCTIFLNVIILRKKTHVIRRVP